MKWDNLRLAPSTTRVVRTIAALTILNPVLTGCATTLMVDEVFLGDPVELDFRVVHSDLPDAMVLWRESPGFNETALTFNPPYNRCDEVSFYVNSIEKMDKPITHKSKELSLVTLENESAELAMWENIPSNDKCAVLLTVGTIKDIKFIGISASTRDGPFKRVNLIFPEPEPPDTSAWPGLVVAPIFDVAWMAAYLAYLPTNRAICPSVSEPLTISFRYPNDEVKESVLTYADARAIYGVSTFSIVGCGNNMHCPLTSCQAYWRTAAMLDLRMEFRREKNMLSVESYDKYWKYQINQRSDHVEDNTKQINYYLEAILTKDEMIITDQVNFDGCEGTWSKLKACASGSNGELHSDSDWELNKDIGTYCPNADLGHADAQANVGDLYYLGKYSLDKDIIQAYVWYSLAADNGSTYAAEKKRILNKEMSKELLAETMRRIEQWQPGSCRQNLLDAASKSPE